MTRKDFELIARVLKDIIQTDTRHLEYIAAEFADALKSTNANFDRERFLKACGVE